MMLSAILLTLLGFLAQHEGHGPQESEPRACVESQREVLALVESASERLEIARQSNEPSVMRAAMEDLQTTLGAIQEELASCAEPEPES
ncbi:MAG: hypothetical protein ACRD21_16105 [Vicinamibacteria bacterium]